MTLKQWNEAQIKEALSDTNRYYFWLKYGRSAENDKELIIYYIFYGGASDFRKNHQVDSP